MVRIIISVIATLLLATACAHAAPVAPTSSAPAAHIEGLLAPHVADDYAQDLHLFGQFAGNWNIRSERYTRDGTTLRSQGGIHIGWILYGTALQDVWEGNLDDATPGARPQGFGTTIRYFDRQIGAWRVVWVAPTANVIQEFSVRQVGSEIWMEAATPEGFMVKWIWSDMTTTSFNWRSEESRDGGVTWFTDERTWATRRD